MGLFQGASPTSLLLSFEPAGIAAAGRQADCRQAHLAYVRRLASHRIVTSANRTNRSQELARTRTRTRKRANGPGVNRDRLSNRMRREQPQTANGEQLQKTGCVPSVVVLMQQQQQEELCPTGKRTGTSRAPRVCTVRSSQRLFHTPFWISCSGGCPLDELAVRVQAAANATVELPAASSGSSVPNF
ncbi:hypothetical protein SCP_0902730 [Sparassis crispa]|uniref:Uncharacterized protein n=1 Tax=Sparassis crispa TaxID=139825 RepID=A0A401GX97_9APHY|nr:hypothetical protein SCP_0902730 [Sparassis crispa]GBE86394.1 hypothetical protein SCP_0902730 [Sparassis crispa]